MKTRRAFFYEIQYKILSLGKETETRKTKNLNEYRSEFGVFPVKIEDFHQNRIHCELNILNSCCRMHWIRTKTEYTEFVLSYTGLNTLDTSHRELDQYLSCQ